MLDVQLKSECWIFFFILNSWKKQIKSKWIFNNQHSIFIINKLAEFNNLMSDSNPYFPMPPCEYGNAMNALRAGDFRSVFVLAEPAKIPLHNFYELVWFMKTGFPRFLRMVTGKQKFITASTAQCATHGRMKLQWNPRWTKLMHSIVLMSTSLDRGWNQQQCVGRIWMRSLTGCRGRE